MVNTGSSNSALRDNTNQRLSILKYVYLLLAEVPGVARGVKILANSVQPFGQL